MDKQNLRYLHCIGRLVKAGARQARIIDSMTTTVTRIARYDTKAKVTKHKNEARRIVIARAVATLQWTGAPCLAGSPI